ncbi:MAG: glycosyltransferase family 39 protein [Anaerolineae bacterium]
MVSDHRRRVRITPSANLMVLCGILLLAFLIMVWGLQQDSLWNDEAWTAWAIRSPYLYTILERVRGDVHPPLYFLVMGALNHMSGDSVLALRWPSALFGMLGLAATYAAGRRLFNRRTGVAAVVVLASHSFFVYYTREARMYSLLLALGAITTLLYWRWLQRPTWWRGAAYGLTLAVLLYTHYAGLLIIATHAAHLVLTIITPGPNRIRWLQVPLPYTFGAILFAPWLPILLQQLRANPNGPLAIPVITDWGAVAALFMIITSGHWLLMAIPLVIGSKLPALSRDASALTLVILWLVVTPIGLLAANAWIAPVYQVRYTIALLPAGALLLGYGLSHIRLSRLRGWLNGVLQKPVETGFMIILGVWLVYTQLAMYTEFWPSKPDWEATMQAIQAARHPLQPIIADFAPYSPASYYNRRLGLTNGLALDLSWRLHDALEVKKFVGAFQDAPSVWAALPVNTVKSWQIVSALDASRNAVYRSSLGNMIFYRFDIGNRNDLQFRFGDLLRYTENVTANDVLTIHAGKRLCIELSLQSLGIIDNSYSYGLHLVDLTENIDAAQHDEGLGEHEINEVIELAPCLDVPTETAAGHYHLELTVYNWATLKRLPVVEDGYGEGVGWGDILMLAAVEITD